MTDEVEHDEQKKPVKETPVVFDEGTFVHETGDTYEGAFEARKKDRFLKMHVVFDEGTFVHETGDSYEGSFVSQKKPVKETPVVFDEGVFVHETEDFYEGAFEARKKDRFLKMNGHGVYTTADGVVYTGHWEGDRLVGEVVTITYADGSKYEGPFKDWAYNGRGKYTYPDGTVLNAEFVENCPVKDMVLTDPNGHVWLGRADVGFGRLGPWNHFYQALERPSEKSQSISQDRAVQHN
ncbi:radial spoke head 1 homolog [Cydia fagiglandana]|uniref:radial spoke head 1 homolog n=1 Tax=Cydia fagiglandana TaxID=1458189 RepID=UPI002FEE3A74